MHFACTVGACPHAATCAHSDPKPCPSARPPAHAIQASTLAFARALLPSRDPLGAGAMGPNRPVFLTEATITTGDRSARVFASHVMLLDAHNTGATTGTATAAAFPDGGFAKVCRSVASRAAGRFVPGAGEEAAPLPGGLPSEAVRRGTRSWSWLANPTAHLAACPAKPPPLAASPVQYEFHVRQVGCRTCPDRIFLSNRPQADFSGLAPGALQNVTVVGILPGSKGRVEGYNWIAFRTQAVLVRLVRAAAATAPCGNTALVTAGGFVGGVATPGAISKASGALLGGKEQGAGI